MGLLERLLNSPAITPEQREQAIKRAISDPGIPPKSSRTPFWLEDPHPRISKISSTKLPEEVDIIIIGAGITAASVARTLLRTKGAGALKVAVLEAGDICSGATGRNGGHINEGVIDYYAEHVQAFGKESAMKIARFRRSHLSRILQAAREEGVVEESQIREVASVVVCFDGDNFLETKHLLAQFKEDMPVESADFHAVEPEEARKEFHIPDIKGALTLTAGAVWPYKLITAIFGRLIDDYPHHLFLESYTPVEKIAAPTNQELGFTVTTPRGIVKARHIIHCTNAHVSHLVPGLRGHLVPVRGHMSAQTPGASFPHQGLHRSWTFEYTQGLDYLTQLPPSYPAKSPLLTGGELMLGGGLARASRRGIEEIGIADDCGELELGTKIHLAGVARGIFEPEVWGVEEGLAVKAMWTGIMGFTVEELPFVGRLAASMTGREAPESEQGRSEWVAAGYSGEGMVNAWGCGVAVAQMVLEEIDQEFKSDWHDWFPEQMLITEQRLKHSILQIRENTEKDKGEETVAKFMT